MNVDQIILPVFIVGLTTVLLIVLLDKIKLTSQFALILAMAIASALAVLPWFQYVPLVGDVPKCPTRCLPLPCPIFR